MKNKLFKHMKSKHAQQLLNKGEIMINNLKYYHSTENLGIKDSTEGYKIMTTSLFGKDLKMFVKEKNDKEFKEVSKNPEFKPLIKFTNLEFQQKRFGQDVYIYCTFLSSENGLFEGYDSCIEITSMNFFEIIGLELLKRKLIAESVIDGKKHLGVEGEILYVKDKKIDRSKKNIMPYFVKDISFIDEKEYRIIYKAIVSYKDETVPPIKLVLPELRKYCKKVW